VILLGPGDTHPVIAEVKRRLCVYPDDETFTEALAQRIRGYQRLRDWEVTGLIEDDLIQHLL